MVDPRDQKSQGDPETAICLPDGGSVIGLQVLGSGFGSIMLGIREDCLGRPLTCAIANTITLDIKPHSRYRDDADFHKGYVEDKDDGS